ncbi:MAG: nuclear transport factor 2 family protein [Leptolyngbyaceae cyanobacterium CRU_2_3]|nr:nuclear transport factor 2 family protein [Leptolyngbyaceae cyanobacterium CRU_2_3]
MFSLLILGMTMGAGQVNAQSVNPGAANPGAANPGAANSGAVNAPPELLQILTQIDAAANQGDLSAVMGFYSRAFINSDGLTYATLQEALKRLWEGYPRLTYVTQVNSWQRDGNAMIAETTTTIATKPPAPPSSQSLVRLPDRLQRQPARPDTNRVFNLTATITSRQRFENQKIVQQEILTEQSQLTSGEQPPTLTVNLPTQVRMGQTYSFDAVVMEPLGNRLLLGAALEEPIQASGYLNATPIELELLSAGGLFKVGRAPIMSDNRWISAIVVRDDGITTVTRRLRVGTMRSLSNPSR